MLKSRVLMLLVVLVSQYLVSCTSITDAADKRHNEITTGRLSNRIQIVDTIISYKEHRGPIYEYDIDGSRYIGRLINDKRSSFLTKK